MRASPSLGVSALTVGRSEVNTLPVIGEESLSMQQVRQILDSINNKRQKFTSPKKKLYSG